MPTAISQIDQQIDAIRKELRSLEKIIPGDASSWQRAWDRHPALRARELDLFRQRGEAQIDRDERAAKEARRQMRAARPKKCPKCGAHTLYGAA